MSPTEYLESIIQEATCALNYANAGSDREAAFNLMFSISDLCSAFESLVELNYLIDGELD